MLPAFVCTPGPLFPINPPMWSIFYELVANILFFFGFFLLKRKGISIALAVLFSLSLIPIVFLKNGLDFGFGWEDLSWGTVRVITSFLIGVAIFNSGLADKSRSDLATAILFIGLGIALFAPFKSAVYAILLVLLAFPAVVIIGIKTNPASAGFVWLCRQLGKTSYVLYVIHKPLYQLIYGSIVKFAPDFVGRAGIWLGLALLSFIIVIAWLIAEIYEPVARRMLRDLGGRLKFRAG